MNEIKCGNCKHYDPILGPREKDTLRGWCVARSEYPAKEGPGQVFPKGAIRVKEGALAKPFLVKKDSVIPVCVFASYTAEDLVDKKRLFTKKSVTNKKGIRIS